ILAVVISVIQFLGDFTARALHDRGGRGGPVPALRFLRPRTPARTAEVRDTADAA
ncbi:ABC transporter permease, partial [Streptomyces sp. SID11233]|nr:ABC transporter permease [Streptomyces sp. SID11233]